MLELRTEGNDSGFWPTPNATDGSKAPKYFAGGNLSLPEAVKRWPTPTVAEAKAGHGYQRAQGRIYPTLTGAVGAAPYPGGPKIPQMWATPTGSAAKGSTCQDSKGKRDLRLDVKGKLNPPWVAWLMGVPIGWTALEVLGTRRFQQWLLLHGIYSEGSK
jgi:hypothetical protein